MLPFANNRRNEPVCIDQYKHFDDSYAKHFRLFFQFSLSPLKVELQLCSVFSLLFSLHFDAFFIADKADILDQISMKFFRLGI
jgi:hypothetical protein